jgi:ubiquinone/menaquinone biosynthesis C-methylase UbiE
MTYYPAKFSYKAEVAEQYDTKRCSSAKWKREMEAVGSLAAKFERGASILDVPVGTGRFLECYENGKYFVVGLDVSFDMLLQAKIKSEVDNYSLQRIVGDAEKLPIQDKSVDYVICIRLLNWVPERLVGEILKEFCRVARRGVIVSVRVRRSLTFREFVREAVIGLIPTASNTKRWGGASVKYARKQAGKARRRLLARTEGMKGNKVSEGYEVHDQRTQLDIFDSIGMAVDEVVPIDETVSYSQKEIRPYSIYSLRFKR